MTLTQERFETRGFFLDIIRKYFKMKLSAKRESTTTYRIVQLSASLSWCEKTMCLFSFWLMLFASFKRSDMRRGPTVLGWLSWWGTSVRQRHTGGDAGAGLRGIFGDHSEKITRADANAAAFDFVAERTCIPKVLRKATD